MSNSKLQDWSGLAAGVLMLVVCWCILFPRVGEQATIRAGIDRLARQGVDPGAMYYTDLEVMTQVDAKLAAIHQTQARVFWLPGPAVK